VSASVNLPLHHKVQKFSSGTSSPRWSRKKGRKAVVVVVKVSAVDRPRIYVSDLCQLFISLSPWLFIFFPPSSLSLT